MTRLFLFYCYGPNNERAPKGDIPNLRLCGAIPFESVPQTLSQYSVGLIPFAGDSHLLDSIDPLKGLQYMAAGLGIASTDRGLLREALGDWACYGNDPASFADAIRQAHARASQPDYSGNARMLHQSRANRM